jgi:hypothetical protein
MPVLRRAVACAALAALCAAPAAIWVTLQMLVPAPPAAASRFAPDPPPRPASPWDRLDGLQWPAGVVAGAALAFAMARNSRTRGHVEFHEPRVAPRLEREED